VAAQGQQRTITDYLSHVRSAAYPALVRANAEVETRRSLGTPRGPHDDPACSLRDMALGRWGHWLQHVLLAVLSSRSREL